MRAREVALYLEQVCAHRLYEVGCDSVPTNLDRLATSLGARIQYEQLHDEGSVERDSEGYLIRIKSDSPEVRKRFSIAHEIGHLIIAKLLCEKDSEDYKRFRRFAHVAEGLNEETLANQIAGILLLPAWFVQSRVGDAYSVSTVVKLAKEANVSISTALIRIVHLSTAPCVAFMARRAGAGPVRLMWHWTSQSIDSASAKSDLADEYVLQTLIQGGYARDESLALNWLGCDCLYRNFDNVTTWHGLARVEVSNRLSMTKKQTSGELAVHP
ncbi:MAG: ImmA/IrrE family metallo-endopeptidase [Phycisphaerales bacterium]